MTARRTVLTRSFAAASVGVLAGLAGCSAAPPPATTPTFVSPAASPSSTSKGTPRVRVATVGDSLMSGFGLDLGDAWPVLLAGRAHLSLTNLACAGMGFVVSGDCGTPYSGFAPALAALQPQIVIVESSSNDFGQSADDIHSATITTVEEMHEAAPKARMVGLSTIWNDEETVPEDTAVTSDALKDAMGMVDGTFIDVGQPLQGHPDWMQEDDVHPTPRGQRAIEQTVMSKLQEADILP